MWTLKHKGALKGYCSFVLPLLLSPAFLCIGQVCLRLYSNIGWRKFTGITLEKCLFYYISFYVKDTHFIVFHKDYVYVSTTRFNWSELYFSFFTLYDVPKLPFQWVSNKTHLRISLWRFSLHQN